MYLKVKYNSNVVVLYLSIFILLYIFTVHFSEGNIAINNDFK